MARARRGKISEPAAPSRGKASPLDDAAGPPATLWVERDGIGREIKREELERHRAAGWTERKS